MNTTNEFKRLVAEKNTTLDAVASYLGMHRTTLYRKTKEGVEELTVGEARKIKRFLRLSESEAGRIFGVV
jgi:predicted DNA-binding transcriptional regulator AlpA